MGREWQGMFVEAREKIVKSINLAKCLKRDIEKWPVTDQKLEESLKLLKVKNFVDFIEKTKQNAKFSCLFLFIEYSLRFKASHNGSDRGFSKRCR